MSDERKQSLFIIAYPEHDTAEQVYKTLRDLEKQDKIDIKTAATVHRKDNGKLKLDHKRRLTVWKGAFGGGAIALVLTYLIAGPAALVGGVAAVVMPRPWPSWSATPIGPPWRVKSANLGARS
jgi:uncharacterized membrane protein